MSDVKHKVSANTLIEPNHTNPDQLEDSHTQHQIGIIHSTSEYMHTDTVHPYACIQEMHLPIVKRNRTHIQYVHARAHTVSPAMTSVETSQYLHDLGRLRSSIT